MEKRIFYDGTPASVERIMDIIGTSGVNNVEGKRLYIQGDYLDKGDCVHVEDGFWWIDHNHKFKPTKLPVAKKEGQK